MKVPQITFPVFVKLKDCGEVACYDSIASMQSHFEQIDVENEEYEVWDGAGIRLRLSVRRSTDWLEVENTERSEPEQLASAIAEFARLQGVGLDTSRLETGDFRGVLDQVTSAVDAKQRSQNWWRRFARRW